MTSQIRRVELAETSQGKWSGVVHQYKQASVTATEEQPEHSGGVYRSLKEILSLSDGSNVYRVKKPETPNEFASFQNLTFLGYAQHPAEGAAFMGVDTGCIQVISDLQNPEDHTYVRQFSSQLREFTPWQSWTPGTKYLLPQSVCELKQQLHT